MYKSTDAERFRQSLRVNVEEMSFIPNLKKKQTGGGPSNGLGNRPDTSVER